MATTKISFKAAQPPIQTLTCEEFLNKLQTGAHGKIHMIQKANVQDLEGGAN